MGASGGGGRNSRGSTDSGWRPLSNPTRWHSFRCLRDHDTARKEKGTDGSKFMRPKEKSEQERNKN